jgi:predicted permease
MDLFFQAFSSTFMAVLQIGVVVLGAGLLVRFKVIDDNQVKALSNTVVYVFLPCLIFSSIIRNFHPETLPFWWMIPLSSVALSIVGIGLAWLFFRRELPEKMNMIPLSSIQNAGYLVLPIGQVLVPDRFSEFTLYVFLYILVHNPIIWSIGKYFTTAGKHTKFELKQLLTIPLFANLAGLFFVFTHTRSFIPTVIESSIHLMGTATVPLATFILGAAMGNIHLGKQKFNVDVSRALLIKLVLIPGLVLIAIAPTPLAHEWQIIGLMLILQGASAPATAIVLQIKTYGGDIEKTQTVLLYSYIACLFTIPFWVALWELVRILS